MKLTRKQLKTLWRILGGGALLIAAVLLPVKGLWRLPLFLIPYFLVGWDVLWKALRNIAHGQVFDENFLMCVATIGALALGEYAEAVGVMLFYQIGELFQSVAVGRSRRSISELMDIRPDVAYVLREGRTVEADPEEVRVGEMILVRPGERVPLDGVVELGSGSVDTAALTGESVPRDVAVGDEVVSGCVSMDGALTIRVTKEFSESTVSKILDLVENAASKKAKAENFITRFARYYTPAVVIGAVLLAVIPSLVTGHWALWTHRALTFLVISCPCALVISVPLSFFGGIGGASSRGVLVKGGNYFELLSRTSCAVFDKTGTLTEGRFVLSALYPAENVTEAELLETAALAESFSNHPIARSLLNAWGGQADPGRTAHVKQTPGFGVEAVVDGVPVLAGSEKLMQRENIPFVRTEEAGTVVYVAKGGSFLGCAVIADRPKPAAAAMIAELKARGIRTVMLTGDTEPAAEAAASALGLDEVHARLLPGDKVSAVETLLQKQPERGVLVYVGDGVNDAPVLSRADVGVAMGALGSDAAIEAADVVLMDDDPSKLIAAMDISKKCMRIVRENIVFSIGVKLLFLILAAFGAASMWGAVFADVGVAVIAILNAGRMLYTKSSTKT